MKEATGEVSMTVVTIVVIAAIAGIATFAMTIGRNWIENTFNNTTEADLNNTGNTNAGWQNPQG